MIVSSGMTDLGGWVCYNRFFEQFGFDLVACPWQEWPGDITNMETKTEPTSTIEKYKYLNRMDETFGTICSLISPELLFHISSCKTPNEAWTTMEGNFGKYCEMRRHMLEVELLTLDPKNFDNIQDLFTNIRICCRNSRLVELINLRMIKKCFLPFSPKLVQNTQCLYPHFIQLGSPLELPGKFLLLRSLSSL
jgi:hypothetical protein